MVKNPLLLGSVAFIVSFGLGLLVDRSFKLALVTGLVTLPAAFLGVWAANRKHRVQQKWTLTDLQIEIRQLRKWEIELHRSLSVKMAAKRKIETEVAYLQAELDRLRIQATEQRKHDHQLNQDLMSLREQRHELETELQQWQAQIYSLEQQRGELDLSLRSLRAEKHKTEVSLKALQDELQLLQQPFAAPQHQDIEQFVIEEPTPPQAEPCTLPHLQPIESYHQLERFPSGTDREQAAYTITFPYSELSQLQKDIARNQPSNLQAERDPEELADEWNEFMKRLPKYELQVLKALVEQGNPSAEIKKIAEENITMPELLIELINDRALNTIGDLIIEAGDGSLTPEISAEYLTEVKRAIELKGLN